MVKHFLLLLVKYMYRIVMTFVYHSRHIYITPTVLFSNTTRFGHWVKIKPKTVISGSCIGNYTYIGKKCYMPETKIGSFCSISDNIQIISETHPTRDYLSTSPVFYSTNNVCGKSFAKNQSFQERIRVDKHYRVVIGNDVWVGINSIIIGGVTIGDGAIIAAGSVVTKDVPPFAVVGGVPAKIIRYRFTPEDIQKVQEMQWWDWDDLKIENNYHLFTKGGFTRCK